MIDTIAEEISNNLLEILVLITFIVIVYLVTRTITNIWDARNSVRLSEIAIQREKLAMLQREKLLADLSEASVVLQDDERRRLDAIREDISVLSRKSLAMMNEIEAKTTRLERGAELAKMQDQAQRIYDQERKLFNIKEEK